MTTRSVRFEFSERTRAICYGGLGLIHRLAHQSALVIAIDHRLVLLKKHFPFHESDHVLNIAYNALTNGRCLQDLELKRNDEAYLNLIGAERIPDTTTFGDFCRRFKTKADINALHNAIDDARAVVWARQPTEFFERAIVDMDGHTAEAVVFSCNDRWDQENLIEQLSNGPRAFQAPVDNLMSNCSYTC